MLTESADDVRASFDSADSCINLWLEGKREEALSEMLGTFDTNPVAGADWAWLAVTWQMTIGKPVDDALAVLRRFPSWVPEWYFANALCLYVKHGDTEISRAALLAAISETRALGKKLLGRTSNDGRPDVDLEGPKSYPEHGTALWNDTPGAISWLESGFVALTAMSDAPSAISQKSTHHKLWSDNYEIGISYLKKGERKKARTSLLSALRDARKIGVLEPEFDITLIALVAGELEADEQVQRALSDLVAAIRELGDADRVKSLRAYKRAGDYYDLAKLTADADNSYRAAVDLLRKLTEEEKANVSLLERADLLEASADTWVKDEVIRSTELLEEAVALKLSFLGEHSELIDTLLELHKCLICQEGTEKRAAEVEALMHRIDPDAKELIQEHHGELL